VTERTVRRPVALRGTVQVPPDKSISHRAALLGALATGRSRVRRFLTADDCLATLDCLRAIGVEWEIADEAPGVATLEIEGVGLHGLREPNDVLDCRNSGTTLNLLAGVLAGQPFTSVLTGDDSLRSRPVDQLIDPLRRMGAELIARDRDRLPPLTIRGGPLREIRYGPVTRAQIKSATLLAGLFAEGATEVEEAAATRDHTERLLHAMGVDVRREGPRARLVPPDSLSAIDLEVPGDVSSAAFWLVAAAAHPDAELLLSGVGVNPTRTGLLDTLATMGATIDMLEERMVGGEPVADLRVRGARLEGTEVSGAMFPRLLDEVPVLAVAAAIAHGTTVVRDAGELREKESDRISALVTQLRKLGVEIEERPDGFVIEGGRPLRGARVSGGGDHRLTMALAVAGLIADGEMVIEDADSVSISYPSFWEDVEQVGESGTGA
jgi:3-phosphoshikimate 1-carboxyvinyltransferase